MKDNELLAGWDQSPKWDKIARLEYKLNPIWDINGSAKEIFIVLKIGKSGA